MHALLGIDLGTTGVKAALFAAEDGHVLSSAFVEYPLLHPQPGWAEQHPTDWWQATATAIRTCLAQAALRDVLGVELVTTNAHEGPAFGAALLAGVASGAYHSIQQACDSMVRLVEHTEPRPEIEQVYARKYETYRALYPALKPILSSLL